MRHRNLNILSSNQFKRLTGVSKNTFLRMSVVLEEAKKGAKKYRGGRCPKLNIEGSLLMTLEYWREYRTYFHIGQSYGVSESSAFKTIRFVENVLIKHRDFSLPGRKALLRSKSKSIQLIDVTESPIERPKKKSERLLLRQEEETHDKDTISCVPTF